MPPFFIHIRNTNMTNQLEVLFPTGKTITISNRTFSIIPFKFGQLPKIIKAISKAQTTVQQLELSGDKVAQQAAMITVLSECGTDLISLLADILDVDQSFIEELEMDEAVELLSAFFEVNADFFTKRVVPLLQKALSK